MDFDFKELLTKEGLKKELIEKMEELQILGPS